MKSIAIMQPTFLPWIGYFDLIDQVDIFIYLDTVEFSKQSWQQRNQIKSVSGSTWINIPVTYSKSLRTTIKDAEVGNLDLFNKIIAQLQHSYAKSKYSKENLSWITQYLSQLTKGQLLGQVNINFIEKVCSTLNINTPRYTASNLPHAATRHQRLIDICKHFNATEYISPVGAYTYLQDDMCFFKQAGIDVKFHQYDHPIYNQPHGAFLSHMSIIDLILNEGANSLEILRKGRLPPQSNIGVSKVVESFDSADLTK